MEIFFKEDTAESDTHSAEETEEVGKAVGALAVKEKYSFIALYGDLGAGKTAFTRGIAAVIAPDAHVCSPTYTIVNEYGEGKQSLFHFDMYRINDEDSLDSIGFYDYFRRGGILVTEWSEKIPFALPERYLRVKLLKIGENDRRILITKVN